MSTATTRSDASKVSNKKDQTESPREITQDIIDAMIRYGRDKPGSAAMICLGVGFALGWKLKPW
jgi:hypothetical protein